MSTTTAQKTEPAAKPAQEAAAKAVAKKKVRKDTLIYKFYEAKQDRVERLRKECPRCGKGVFLAEHKDRMTCGKCGYTSFRKQKQ